MDEKNAKITKQSPALKGSGNYYNVAVFNPELLLENTESTIRNKLIDLLSELKGFKLVTILVLEFKKI